MRKKDRIRKIVLAGLLTLSLLSKGCGGKTANNEEQPPDFITNCVAVAPATTAIPPDSDMLSQIEQKELKDGLYYLNKFLKKHFLSRKDVRLFSDGQFGDAEDAAERPSLQRAQKYADKLSCNAVLETTLHRYQERVGGELTAEKPASAAFDYRLLAMPDGKVLCQNRFDAQQESLMENLLSFREGTGGALTWLSAEDFMKKALRNRLEKCPYLAEKK